MRLLDFYKEPDYLERTRREFSQKETLPPIYTWNSSSKYLDLVLSFLFFPRTIVHSLAGKFALLPASTPKLMRYSSNHAHESRSRIALNGDWKYKRFTVVVDGYHIDAAIIGEASTLHNGRWVLCSNGNGEFYEDKLRAESDTKQLLSHLHANGIVFNYPGVGASSGFPNRVAMAKAYSAMLSFLESEIRAKQVIGYGHSIGAAVQGDATKIHTFKETIQYLFVKSRTFTNLADTAASLTNRLIGWAVLIVGWNYNSEAASYALKHPEIILQTANVSHYKELTDSSKIIGDGIIRAKVALAKAILDTPYAARRKNKTVIGIPEKHNDGLRDPAFLARLIEQKLR